MVSEDSGSGSGSGWRRRDASGGRRGEACKGKRTRKEEMLTVVCSKPKMKMGMTTGVGQSSTARLVRGSQCRRSRRLVERELDGQWP